MQSNMEAVFSERCSVYRPAAWTLSCLFADIERRRTEFSYCGLDAVFAGRCPGWTPTSWMLSYVFADIDGR
jgi:hypothetical protein